MKTSIKVLLHPKEPKNKSGYLFEDLVRTVLQTQRYEISQNVNFTGLEVDLIATHKDSGELAYIECKAKEKVKSEDIKNFEFNVRKRRAKKGYFIYTEELEHQAEGLRREIQEDKDLYSNIYFFGPEKVLELLIDAGKIKNIDLKVIEKKYSIQKLLIIYSYFGFYYLLICLTGNRAQKYILFNAINLEPVYDLKLVDDETIEKEGGLENVLMENVRDLKGLKFEGFGSEDKKESPETIATITTDKQLLVCDVPPNNSFWVGRTKELEILKTSRHKVVFITGIGGQGKSGLASHYVKNIVPQESFWEFWDWRDCKEEGNRIHTKLISIINRLTNAEFNLRLLSDESLDNLIELLFIKLAQRKIVFVFDNIDHYVDYQEFTLTSGVGKLFEKALEKDHNSKFIFTCRTVVKEASVDYLMLELTGLSLEDTKQIFRNYNGDYTVEEFEQITYKAYELTKGHPLWLNLTAAQSINGKDAVFKLIEGLRLSTSYNDKNIASILASNVLKTIWDTLNYKQQILLRGMAETVRSETEKDLSIILSPELNYNQFLKSFRALSTLNLIVVKSRENEPDVYELHPLVKEYVRQKYARNERTKFITLFVNYYNNLVFILKPRLSHEQPLSFFENWTAKIELEINKEDYKTALISLAEVHESILAAGFVEEYLRVAYMLFLNIDWKNAIVEEYSYFHDQFYDYVKTLIEFGKYNEAEINMKKYYKYISGKGVNYIALCDLRCYLHWYRGQFKEAILFGEEGLELGHKLSPVPTDNCGHTLALARRDTLEKGNVRKAMEYFLRNEKLKDVLAEDINENFDGQFYGNIGRCLHFLGSLGEALICYKKSLATIYREKHTAIILNQGYACLWIAEILEEKKDFRPAVYFFRNAVSKWSIASPIRSQNVVDKLDKLISSHADLKVLLEVEEQKVERFCREWVKA